MNYLKKWKRKIVQLLATILCNCNIKGLIEGKIYKGASKGICVPGLNCYSCPAATGACPLGSLQNTLGGIKGKWNVYVIGSIILMGTVLGRFICGWLCPFGFLQELLYKISSKIFVVSLKKVAWIKYVIFGVFVILIPIISVMQIGVGIPGFCKYICPQGTIAGIMLFAIDEKMRGLAGTLFWIKFAILIVIIVWSIFVFRPFCRVLCPLGVIYGWFNKIALLQMEVEKEKCTSCQKCSNQCPLKLQPMQNINSSECIRCGKCVEACPSHAIRNTWKGIGVKDGRK